MSLLHYHYLSTLGTICVVPRPRLSKYITQGGKPCAVFYQEQTKGRNDLWGIRECDYAALEPDLVVFELGDGSLLAATQQVMGASKRNPSRAWKGHKTIDPLVKQLQVLEELPVKLTDPIYNF